MRLANVTGPAGRPLWRNALSTSLVVVVFLRLSLLCFWFSLCVIAIIPVFLSAIKYFTTINFYIFIFFVHCGRTLEGV